MAALKSSAASRPSKILIPSLLAFAALAAMSAAAVAFVQSEGTALYYGDAAAHLNIARRLVDGRHPGYEQIGTVWLPLPHVAMMPFVQVDAWWRNGLAGALPAAIAWVLGGTLLYVALRRWFGADGAFTGVAVFATQPNLLYLQATPMTESFFFAAAIGLLWFSARATESQPLAYASLAGLCGIAATMTRYEGWFLLPFVAIYLFWRGGWHSAFVFCLVAGLGPIYWFAHNYYFYSDPLEFYRGLGSPKDIQKGLPYPGAHDWGMAIRQFSIATKAVLGWPLIGLSALGLFFALRARLFWPLCFGALAPLYYIINLHGGDSPIYVPEVYPFAHYNSRYALAALPLCALCCAALGATWPKLKWAIPALALAWLLVHPPLVKREGQLNSISRRQWTAEVADLLRQEYRPGDGILMPFGDLTAILQEAGIPIRESIHQGDGVEYERILARPDLFLDTGWAVVIAGEPAAQAVARAARANLPYTRVKLISLKHAPVIEVWRRRSSFSTPPSP